MILRSKGSGTTRGVAWERRPFAGAFRPRRNVVLPVLGVAAACCAGVATAQTAVPQTSSGGSIAREWRGDSDFYAILVAHDRAELAWRHFRNRLCAMPEPRRTSLGHVVRETRERLDAMRSRIEMLWPGAPSDRLRFMARVDPEPKMLCHDPVAADEAFQAALAGHDGTQYLIRLVERARHASGQR